MPDQPKIQIQLNPMELAQGYQQTGYGEQLFHARKYWWLATLARHDLEHAPSIAIYRMNGNERSWLMHQDVYFMINDEVAQHGAWLDVHEDLMHHLLNRPTRLTLLFDEDDELSSPGPRFIRFNVNLAELLRQFQAYGYAETFLTGALFTWKVELHRHDVAHPHPHLAVYKVTEVGRSKYMHPEIMYFVNGEHIQTSPWFDLIQNVIDYVVRENIDFAIQFIENYPLE